MRSKKNTEKNKTLNIKSTAPWRLTAVKALDNYVLEVSFVDGTHGFVDMKARVNSPDAGVFSALKDTHLFSQVYLQFGAATWPGEIDLAPDTMHEAIKKTGRWTI